MLLPKLFCFIILSSAFLCLSYEPRNPEGNKPSSSSLVTNFHLDSFLVYVSVFTGVVPFSAVEALINVKMALNDPHGVLSNWDEDSVDPCSWAMITCSPENLVIGL